MNNTKVISEVALGSFLEFVFKPAESNFEVVFPEMAPQKLPELISASASIEFGNNLVLSIPPAANGIVQAEQMEVHLLARPLSALLFEP